MRAWRIHSNPVLRRELIERWRGRRAFVVLTVYLGLLTTLVLLLLWAGTTAMRHGAVVSNAALGRFLFENVVGLVLLLVLFVGPGYAAAQISQERERRTLGLLQITLVTPWRIVLGKLGAASAWLLLLVLAAAPMAAIGFFLGGIAWTDLIRSVAYVVGITVAVAAAGIGISSMVRRTVAAVVLTYALVLGLVGGTVFATIIEMVAIRDTVGENRPVSLMANPFLGLADAARVTPEAVQLPSMLTPFSFALPPENQGGFRMFADVPGPEQGFAEERIDDQPARRPVWLITLGVHAALGAAGLAMASRRVRPDRSGRRRPPPGRERVLTAAAPPGAGPPVSDGPPPPPPSPPPPPPGARLP